MSHRRRHRARGKRDAVGITRAGRRFLDLRDGHAGPWHRVRGARCERQGCGDGVRQPGRDDQPGPLPAAGRHATDRRRRPLQSRRRHHGGRRQRRQCVRGVARRVFLLRAQHHPQIQAGRVERLLFRRGVGLRGQLVRALLRPEGRAADARGGHQRRVQDQRLALRRGRALGPLRQSRTEVRAQQPARRAGRPTEVRGRRIRLRRHGRGDARTHRGHPVRRDLHLAGQARLRGPPVDQESRSDISGAAEQPGAVHAPARPRPHGAAAGHGERLSQTQRPPGGHGQSGVAELERVRQTRHLDSQHQRQQRDRQPQLR